MPKRSNIWRCSKTSPGILWMKWNVHGRSRCRRQRQRLLPSLTLTGHHTRMTGAHLIQHTYSSVEQQWKRVLARSKLQLSAVVSRSSTGYTVALHPYCKQGNSFLKWTSSWRSKYSTISSATRSTVRHSGSGRVKHLEACWLWLVARTNSSKIAAPEHGGHHAELY